MERESLEITQRLEAAATLLERTLGWLEERQNALSGEVERISATVEQSRREEELALKLEAAEKELADLKSAVAAAQHFPGAPALNAASAPASNTVQPAANPLRRTVPGAAPSSNIDMLAKHGIGEGPVDSKALDAALTSLSIEQRIAVKSQLLRAGAVA